MKTGILKTNSVAMYLLYDGIWIPFPHCFISDSFCLLYFSLSCMSSFPLEFQQAQVPPMFKKAYNLFFNNISPTRYAWTFFLLASIGRCLGRAAHTWHPVIFLFLLFLTYRTLRSAIAYPWSFSRLPRPPVARWNNHFVDLSLPSLPIPVDALAFSQVLKLSIFFVFMI